MVQGRKVELDSVWPDIAEPNCFMPHLAKTKAEMENLLLERHIIHSLYSCSHMFGWKLDYRLNKIKVN